MPVCEFQLIPAHEKEAFRSIFGEYIEEITLLVGRSIDLEHMYAQYNFDQYFKDDPTFQPFKIFYVDQVQNQINKIYVGFFFLKLITPEEIPAGVPKILSKDYPIAYLTEFYLFKEYRGKKYAWEFYNSIIRFCTENTWNCCWECDIRNTPAIGFYKRILERIEKEVHYDCLIYNFLHPKFNNASYYFYQIKFFPPSNKPKCTDDD